MVSVQVLGDMGDQGFELPRRALGCINSSWGGEERWVQGTGPQLSGSSTAIYDHVLPGGTPWEPQHRLGTGKSPWEWGGCVTRGADPLFTQEDVGMVSKEPTGGEHQREKSQGKAKGWPWLCPGWALAECLSPAELEQPCRGGHGAGSLAGGEVKHRPFPKGGV